MDYVQITFGILWTFYFWDTYLDSRQHKKLGETERPKGIKDIVTQEKFDKAQAYGRDKSTFGFVKGVYTMIWTSVVLHYGLNPLLWNWSVDWTEQYFGYDASHEVTVSVVFFLAYSAWELVTGLPFELYYNFVVEEKHGFNKQTLSLFFTDKVKSMFFMLALGAPCLAMFLHVIKWGGEYFYVYVCVFVLVLQLVMMTIYPVFIQPCFNTVEPLPEGELKSAIEKLAESIDYPLKKLYQIDGSKRSGHSNAYMYGFCSNKRIVLFDTLIEQSTVEEVVAVLGHELGHWKLNHTIKMIVSSQLQVLSQFWLFGQVMYNETLFKDFGFTTMPTFMGLILFTYLSTPLSELMGFMNILMTRMHEFHADAYAVGLGKGAHLKSGLIKLQLENLGNMNPDTWYSTYHYSHPPLVERLSAMDAEMQRLSKKDT